MSNGSITPVARRQAYLCGPGLALLRRLAQQGLVNVNVYDSRDGRSACLLGHIARTPPLRADGWRFINGIPHWSGWMGVGAARGYFGLEWQQALDLFGNRTESRAVSLEHRLRLIGTLLQRNMSNIVNLAV